MTKVDLLRRLGFKESFAIVVGSIIGTGIFLKTAVMAQDAGSPLYVLLALLTAGALSFIGALIYAELGCLFPAAGGEYVFLREAYGLSLWMDEVLDCLARFNRRIRDRRRDVSRWRSADDEPTA